MSEVKGSIGTKGPKAQGWAPKLLTRSTRFAFQREQISENCFIMPFRFTIITAARTACSRDNVARVAERFLEADSLHHPGMTTHAGQAFGQSPAHSQLPPHTNLNPLELIRKF